ncbi:MAG: 2-phospho-L-lactate guanylyltransferase [Gammaproteobacteria bacterium]|nr:MAG: 2-phospho-L-lactate guanylyltransferase [Gammaproteobacteria bacterium]
MNGVVWAVLPVRSFNEGKQRLANGLDAAQREALCRALLDDALTALRGSQRLAGVVVVSADEAVLAAATSAGVMTLLEHSRGLNAAVMQGALWVKEQGADTVLVMHADLPLVSTAAIDEVIDYHQCIAGRHCTLVPDRHGQGTNALLLSPPCAMPFAFGEGSLDKHLMGGVRQGLRCCVLPQADLACDLDTPDDLACIRGKRVAKAGKALGLLAAS